MFKILALEVGDRLSKTCGGASEPMYASSLVAAAYQRIGDRCHLTNTDQTKIPPNWRDSLRLFLTVFLGMGLAGFFGVISGVHGVASRSVSVMRGFFVLSAIVMLRCFAVVPGGMRMVL